MGYDVNANLNEIKKYSDSKYFGQWETDRIIEEYFEKGYVGKCIDVGAADGVRGSNSMYFEDIGWDVLCLEPNVEHAESLENKRKLFMQFACGDTNGDVVPFHIFKVGDRDISTSITSLTPDERLVKDHEHVIRERYVVNVPVRTLTDILENETKGIVFEGITDIDFISIDTEGTELDVLKGFDFNKFNVKLFVVENNYNDAGINVYMNEQGYIKDQRYKINDFFVRGK